MPVRPPSRRELLAAGALLLPRPLRAAPLEAPGTDARLELLAALARVAGYEEYGGSGFPAWSAPIDRAFRSTMGGLAVRMLRAARKEHGLGYDALPSLAVHLAGEPGALALLDPLAPWPAGLDSRWRGVDLPRFLSALNKAGGQARFPAVWVELAPLRATLASLVHSAAQSIDMDWFDAWFGFPAPGRASVVASPLCGDQNYGVRRTGREPELLAVLGVTVDPDSGLPRVGGPELLVHEVGHSFVNSVLAENERFLAGPGGRLFAAVRERMEGLHYGSWSITVNESVLRAVVVRYLLAHGGPSAARQETARQLSAGFPWTLVLADALQDYEANRDRYPTFGDYAPALAATLDVIASEETVRAGGRPRVVRIEPDSAQPVPASSPALVVTFSRRMHPQSWSIVGAPEDTPPSGAPSFDASGTVFTLPWRLTPGRTYRFSLNTLRHQNFRSDDGVPLEPVTLVVTVER